MKETASSDSGNATDLIFPAELSIRMDWSEMDLFGHINNVSYFKYIQASRVNYWDAVGMLRFYSTEKLAPILASSTCNFRQPLHYPGHLTVRCRMDFIRNTSFGFQHQILNEKGEIAAEAKDVMVFFNFGTNQKQPLHPEIRKAAEKLEQRQFS